MDTCQFYIIRSFRSLRDFPAIKPNHWVPRILYIAWSSRCRTSRTGISSLDPVIDFMLELGPQMHYSSSIGWYASVPQHGLQEEENKNMPRGDHSTAFIL
jgi:hypothetical protein